MLFCFIANLSILWFHTFCLSLLVLEAFCLSQCLKSNYLKLKALFFIFHRSGFCKCDKYMCVLCVRFLILSDKFLNFIAGLVYSQEDLSTAFYNLLRKMNYENSDFLEKMSK